MRNPRRRTSRKHAGRRRRKGWDGVTARVVGEASAAHDDVYSESYIGIHARRQRARPTPAEAAFEQFLLEVSDGVLEGEFKSQHVASGKWILDFFFPKIRLAVEIDGSVHQKPEQMERDRQKEEDCARFDITLIRITNEEVFGDREPLTEKLRDGWRQALQRENKIIGKESC
jgi:very-short-patch-repair endonuclease